MKKRIAKKIILRWGKYTVKQRKKAFAQVKRINLHLVKEIPPHGLRAGKTHEYHIGDVLNIEDLLPPYEHFNGQHVITDIGEDDIIISYE